MSLPRSLSKLPKLEKPPFKAKFLSTSYLALPACFPACSGTPLKDAGPFGLSNRKSSNCVKKLLLSSFLVCTFVLRFSHLFIKHAG